MSTQRFERLGVGGQRVRGFTLVELLVVIAIIGMLAALLMPAINSARESARQAQCTNNQRNLALAALQYATAKEYFPGYRDLIPDQRPGDNPYMVISWQVALLANMGKTDVYQALQGAGTTFTSPYWEASICPSDNTIVGKTSPWTSYVANTGYLDALSPQPDAFDRKANGVLMDRARTGNSKPKVSLTDIKDGQATTLLISENLDSNFYIDQPVVNPLVTGTNPPTKAQVDAKTYGPKFDNCTERVAGFLWWDTSATATASPPPVPGSSPPSSPTGGPNNKNPAGINVDKGSWDPGSDTTASNPGFYQTTDVRNYAARPSSNHPGGVIVSFVGGNTRFLREDIDYPVYCLLMTSDGANACNQANFQSNYATASTNSQDADHHSWQKYKTLDEGSL